MPTNSSSRFTLMDRKSSEIRPIINLMTLASCLRIIEYSVSLLKKPHKKLLFMSANYRTFR
ncbi:hypothetical protein HanPSC8_Chr08g0341221 [Helianthus annuus]|nr:hypothetical protein HanPSC8_Chr08g0341221 [Helianthus annuus]